MNVLYGWFFKVLHLIVRIYFQYLRLVMDYDIFHFCASFCYMPSFNHVYHFLGWVLIIKDACEALCELEVIWFSFWKTAITKMKSTGIE